MSENGPVPVVKPAGHSIADFTFDDLKALLRRAVRLSAVLGAAIALVLWLRMGWQTAALFVVGGAISIASIYEWGRLIRVVGARMDAQETVQVAGQNAGRGSGLGTGVVVSLFLVRLILFAGAIYGSLKCFHGSPIALLGGLGLGLVGLVWEAMRVLRQ